MAAALEDSPVTYEELVRIELDFDDANTEIIRQQAALTAPLYERRSKVVSQIANFWPLVLEQAPPDIDQYIQPSDSALLLTHLTSFSVRRFEIDSSSPDKAHGDPRSISIRFDFSPNEHFSDSSLEKKFWYRKSPGYAGLVSEPVRIQWKKGRDLTAGLLNMVCDAWEVKQNASNATAKASELSPQQKILKKKIENTSMGGLSFFAWFGYIGRHISTEENAVTVANEIESRLRRQAGKTSPPVSSNGGVEEDEQENDDEDDEDDENDEDTDLEIFPDGDDLAVAFTEDLWPDAIKYFTQAQEQDALSDADFESDGEDLNAVLQDSDDSEGADNGRPAKKPRL